MQKSLQRSTQKASAKKKTVTTRTSTKAKRSVATTKRKTTSPSTTTLPLNQSVATFVTAANTTHNARAQTLTKKAPVHQSKRFARKDPFKALYVTGPFYPSDNNSLPVLTENNYYDDHDPDLIQQYRNTYTKFFSVPCLLASETSRDKQTKDINASNNKIIQTLRHHMAEAKKKSKQFYLVELPMTPNYSNELRKVYENDPPEFSIPPNAYPLSANTVDPKENWGQIHEIKNDMMDLWQELHPGKKPASFYAQADTLAITQTTRVASMIQNRIKNPELYHAFGLDDSIYHTRLTMYAIHVWLYCRAVQYRPVYQAQNYRTALIKALDASSEQALYYDFRFLNSKDRHSIIQTLLPYYRSFMINLDKAFASLTAGDPEPMYGILYRGLYRANEFNRHYPINTDPIVDKSQLRGLPYSSDLEVYMQHPPSLTHMNNLIDYIVNIAYDMQTKSPRDYSMVLNGFIDAVDFQHWLPKTAQTAATPAPQPTATPTPTPTPSPAPTPTDNTPEVTISTSGDAKTDAAKALPIHKNPMMITPPPRTPAPTEPLPTIVGSPVPISTPPAATLPWVSKHKNQKLLQHLTSDEMLRWCYPVYQATTSPFMPTLFERIKFSFSPPKPDMNNWFLTPKDQGEPAWRPPSYSLTATGRKP